MPNWCVGDLKITFGNVLCLILGGSIQKKSDRTFMCGFYWSKYGY